MSKYVELKEVKKRYKILENAFRDSIDCEESIYLFNQVFFKNLPIITINNMTNRGADESIIIIHKGGLDD